MLDIAPTRRFVPQQLSFDDFSQLQTLFQSLLQRNINSPEELERWLLDYSELYAAIDEFGQRRYIDKSRHTDDPEIEKAFFHFVENIEPKVKPLHFAMQKKLVESPHRAGLTDPKYAILIRHWQADVELFREQNVPLETEQTKLVAEYDKINGAMTVNFRGAEYTLQQMSRFQEDPDRGTRQAAWEATVHRRLRDADRLEDLFDEILKIRWQIARNAGVSDPRAFYFKQYKRFDYTPEDCLRFADAVAETFVPLMRALDSERASSLGLSRLRPWDLAVDPRGRPPLRPFEETDIDRFVGKTHEIFRRISPALAEDFEILRRHQLLDLSSRKGKAPGGYQALLAERREPFIFMNAVGTQDDVRVLLHEGGHAFHSLAARHEPLVFLIHAPLEFCEVASMSMELLGAPHFELFYDDPADAARAARDHLTKIVRTLPWVATIDSFQHWIYTHPKHTRRERTEAWLELAERFYHQVDWTNWQPWNERRWMSQLHIFHVPFYYIEYGIAQLGALQVWLKAKSDPQQALANYRAALRLGGTRPLPQLFAAAGIHFDFSRKTLAPLAAAVAEELARLPE
ncbi:MAG: M3 family oligoendopeptidase [Phycisphaerae bacterium]|nr:M3 family oligoendopeptidase [Phycisphaerae bacterium]MDW8261125.1 M3 family oligoendopeptidase [Phycisphaerales bacterium]